jgi:hypothetical protein
VRKAQAKEGNLERLESYLMGGSGRTPFFASMDERRELKIEVMKKLAARLRDKFTEQEAQDFLTGFSGFTIGDDPYEQVAARIVDKWATSSGDGDTRAIAVQLRARELFDLDGYNPGAWDATSYRLRDAREFADAHKKVIDATLNEMYSWTQEDLKKAGINEMILFRGMALPRGDSKAGIDFNVGEFRLQPLSSFTSRRSQAHSFAADWATSNDRLAIAAVRVPREKIFSTARTGFGCLNESEFVVLGQKGGYRTAYATALPGLDAVDINGEWYDTALSVWLRKMKNA